MVQPLPTLWEGRARGKGRAGTPEPFPRVTTHSVSPSLGVWGLGWPFLCFALLFLCPQSGMQRAPGILVRHFWWFCQGFPKFSLAKPKFPSSCHPGDFPTLQSWFKFFKCTTSRKLHPSCCFQGFMDKRHVFSLTKCLSLQRRGVPGTLWLQIYTEQMVSHSLSYLLTLTLCPGEQLSHFCHGKEPARTQRCSRKVTAAVPRAARTSFHPLHSWRAGTSQTLSAWTVPGPRAGLGTPKATVQPVWWKDDWEILSLI